MRGVVLSVVLVCGCASGVDENTGGGGGADAAGSIDAPVGGGIDAPPGTPDASGGGGDAATGVDASGGGLDPDLSVPDPGNAVCTDEGYKGTCGSLEVCRFYDAQEGRCESCSPCGNLNASCSASDQCDILFMCYQGKCTNFCTLGTTECGAPADCIDIGHPDRGVCRPF